MTKNKKTRLCSYCSGIKHTIKNCPEKIQHLKNAEILNSKARNEILDLMKELKICVGSLIELKFCDFKQLRSDSDDPEYYSTTKLFYIDRIIWKRINKSFLDSFLDKNLVEYFNLNGYIRNNFVNVVLVNPDYPDGYSATLTLDKLKKMKSNNSFPNNSNIGDFIVHDSPPWLETEKTIPHDFLNGKFYKIINFNKFAKL